MVFIQHIEGVDDSIGISARPDKVTGEPLSDAGRIELFGEDSIANSQVSNLLMIHPETEILITVTSAKTPDTVKGLVEIEVTPEMIDEGLDAMKDLSLMDDRRHIVETIYLAMEMERAETKDD